MPRPRLLVTGFSAFPGARRNPSERLVSRLDVDRLTASLDIDLVTAILPTEYAQVRRLLPGLWSQIRPHAVLHFGLNGRAGAVHVETRAKNHMTPVRPDAAGLRPDWPEIERSGPAIRYATLPVARLVAALRRREIPVRTSPDAGGYLCNFAAYLSLGLAPPGAMAGFIHLPWPREAAAPAAPAGRPDWNGLGAALDEAIRVTAIVARLRLRGGRPRED